MNPDNLNCQICQEAYNDDKRAPRILPKCGHTVCSDCLNKILKSSSRSCPFDSSKFSSRRKTAKDFKKNFALLGFLSENNNKCSQHPEIDLIYTCLQDGSKVCSECVLNGDHQGHKAKLTKDLKLQMKEKQKKIDASLKTLSLNRKRYLDELQEKEYELVKNIKERFSDIRESLEDRELEMIYGTKMLINSERTAIFLGSRQERDLVDSLNNEIKDLESFEKSENFLLVKDKDFDAGIFKSESDFLKDVINQRKGRLDQIAKSINTATSKQNQALNQINAFPKTALNEIYHDFQIQECPELMPKVDPFASKLVQTPSCLELVQIEDCLNISFSTNKPQIINIQPSIQWENIKRLSFDFSQGNILNEDLTIIASIRRQLKDVSALSVKFNSNQAQQTNLAIILRSILIYFKRLDKLQELDINLEDCKVNEKYIVHLLENFVRKAVNLTRLRINLDSTLITDLGVQSLFKSIQDFKSLEYFWLNLFDTRVSDKGFEDIYTLIETTTKLHLNLQGTQITDKTLMSLADDIRLIINKIQTFSLNLGETLITDKGVCYLMKNLKGLRNFALNLIDTDVHDESAIEISEYIQNHLQNSEYTSIRLEGTKISEKFRIQLDATNLH